MITVAHIIDDAAVGGVSKGLLDRIGKFSSGFDCKPFLVHPVLSLQLPKRRNIAVVHFTVSWAKLPFMIKLRAQYGTSPIIIVEHSYTEAFERLHVSNKRRFRRMLRLNYRLADVVVAVSEGQAAWLLKIGAVPASKLVVIQSATDCSSLYNLPAPRKRQGALKIAAYGRYSQQKAFDVLIEAMRLVPSSTASLELAGYGELEQPLRAQVRGMPNVTMAGKIDGNLSEFLARADIVIIPSRYEAFGIVAVEARSAARPVIASAVDGLPEQLREDYGILIPPDDPSAIANAIDVISKRDLTGMGNAARASAMNHFDKNVAKWTSLFCKVSNTVET